MVNSGESAVRAKIMGFGSSIGLCEKYVIVKR